MIKKLGVRTPELTMELAKSFATMKPLPGERELRSSRLEWIRDLIKTGVFFSPEWAEALDKESGNTYRVNGQHTSTVLSELSPEQFPKGLKAHITTFEIDSVAEDGRPLFELFDHPISARSAEDVMGVGRARHAELAGITRKFLLHVGKGITASINHRNETLKANYSKAKKKDPELFPPVLEHTYNTRKFADYFENPTYLQFAVWLHSLSKPNVGMRPQVKNEFVFSQAGVVAVMLADWERDAEFSSKFWCWVLNESHPDVDHLSRQLAIDLCKLKESSSRRTQRDYFRVALRASKNAAMMVEPQNQPSQMMPPPASDAAPLQASV